MSRTFLTLVCLFSVAAAANVCQQGRIVNMPSSGKPFYWPTSWNENSTAPQLQNHQSCSWTVTVPQGYYAKLIIDGKTANSSGQFQTIDAAGNLITTTHENKEPYYYPPAKFTIAVENSGTTHFAFKIVWAPFPKTEDGINYGVGEMGYTRNASNLIYDCTFGSMSGNQVSLLTFKNGMKHTFDLRSALVFSGHNTQGSYLTNLFLVEKTKNQWVAPAGNIYVYNLEAVRDSTNLLLVQDYSHTKDISKYTVLDCFGQQNCTVTVNGGTKKSAVISDKPVTHFKELLNHIQMEANANVTVYYGSPGGFTYFTTINSTQMSNELTLPYDFGWGLISYVVSHGKAIFDFSF